MQRPLHVLQLVLSAAVLTFAASAQARAAAQPLGVYEVKNTPKQRVYIDCSSAQEHDIIELRKKLVERGAEKVNLFFLSVIVCEIPLDKNPSDVIDDPRFPCIEEFHIDSKMPPGSEPIVFAKQCYEGAETVAAGLEFRPDFRDLAIENDPELVERSSRRPAGASAAEPTRKLNQNSEFLIGSVLIQLVFPESNGFENTEQWTDKELRDAKQGAVSAALGFQLKFANLPIDFVFNVAERVPCDFEPIRHRMQDDPLTWIPDVMGSLGYSESDEAALNVHEYNNDGRNRFGTDWVYTAFIADSRNEPGNVFSGGQGGVGYLAYAQLGGPYLVVPFPAGDSDPHGLGEVVRFMQVFQHEMLHTFWALDEYPSAPFVHCGSLSGYLNYLNLNRQTLTPVGEVVGCPDYVNCIMGLLRPKLEDGQPVCRYTLGQIGTIDANANNVPDVFDMAPTVEFEGAPAETVTTPEITLHMKARSRAVPNLNIHEPDPINYAAPLKSATIDVDGTNTFFVDPVDGKWGGVEEDLTFSLRGLYAGLTQVSVETRNAFGIKSARKTKNIYFIGLNFTHFSFDTSREGIMARWQTFGETFGARFDLYRIETVSGGADTVLVAPFVVPDNPGDVFQRYWYLDADVEAGHRYRYFVRGSFELGAPGSEREFATHSKTFDVTAMMPMGFDELMSRPAPNPFREETTLSVDVPKTLAEPDTYSRIYGMRRELPTPLSVSVYDVTGRRVKAIYSGQLFAQVETFVWDGTNANNERVPSGIYFIKAVAGSTEAIRKVVVVR